jgi:peroxiredoxin
VPTLKEFKAKEKMQIDLLSDFKRDASRAYGVLHEEKFFSKRAYFLIDGTGVLRWSHVESEPGQKRDTAELLGELQKLSVPA